MRTIHARFLSCIISFLILATIAGKQDATAGGIFEPANVVIQEKITGLTQPLAIANAGDGTGWLFIVERAGTIRIFANGTFLATPFLDIDSIVNSTSSEQGLLALAFHPDYDSNGFFYTAHTVQDGSLVLSRFTRSSNNPNIANPNSRISLLTIPHPTHTNHNGGTLAFGPDGYLYWSTGDGGGGDPFNNAQNLNSLLGKILRLDVNNSDPGLQYAIPPTNPYYNTRDHQGEIWAYGLRNPWKISFDLQTGDLFIGDVGQSAREEINFQAAASTGGENYGWPIMEGSTCYNATICNQSRKILPVAEYTHSLGCSVTGGFIYRGSLYPSMQGHTFYGDFCSGRLFHLHNEPGSGWISAQISDTPYFISTFGQDEQGELFLADYGAGKIYQICYASAINVAIGGVNRNPASLRVGQSTRQSYPDVDNGPVKIASTDGSSLIAAMRAIWSRDGQFSSYSELMGLPKEQLSTTYYFPWYNFNVPTLLDEQLRFGVP